MKKLMISLLTLVAFNVYADPQGATTLPEISGNWRPVDTLMGSSSVIIRSMGNNTYKVKV